MVTSRIRYFALVALILALGAVAAHADTYWFAAVARSEGANGTFFKTDAAFHNPTNQSMTVALTYLPATGSALDFTFVLSAGQTRNFVDILSSFGVTANTAGGMKIVAAKGLIALSRTYTPSNLVPGTFGQFVPSRGDSDVFLPGEVAHIVGLKENADFRSNVGALNTSETDITLTVKIFAADGTLLTTSAQPLAARRWVQWNRVFTFFQVAPQEVARMELTTNAGSFLAYGSTVDNRPKSGDQIFIPAAKADDADDTMTIPAAAHVTGVGGAQFQTDVFLYNTGAAQTVTVQFLEQRVDNTAPRTATIPMNAGETLAVADIVRTLFGLDPGVGALRFLSDSDLHVVSRTYDNRADASFGQFIRGFEDSDAIEQGEVAALVNIEKSAAFRTNAGFVNMGATSNAITMVLLASDGTLLGSKGLLLAPREQRQINDIVGSASGFGLAALTQGTLYVTSDSGVPFIAYKSALDNLSQDSVFGEHEELEQSGAAGPNILYFTADTLAFAEQGGTTTMRWATIGADTVTLNGETVADIGTRSVTVTGPQTFTLIATAGAASDSQTITISTNALPNQSPVANITVTPSSGTTSTNFSMSGLASTDADGSIVQYSWTFGDGQEGLGPSLTHSYAAAGTYTITLTVRDDDNATGVAFTTVTVTNPQNQSPTAVITVTPASGTTATNFNISGSGSFDPDGTITSYSWNFGDSQTATGANTAHTYAAPGTYTITLTVTDNGGATDSATRNVTVTSPQPTTLAIDITGFAFVPANPTVNVGTTITWTNRDTAPHTVTSTPSGGPFGSEILNRNDTYTKTVTAADIGTRNYFCEVHPSMTGSVNVVP